MRNRTQHKGFTLIEMVIGIIVLAVAMLFFTSAYLPLASRSVDPLLEMKASELASALFSELRSKRFDEHSDPNGSLVRCGEQSTTCTLAGEFGVKDLGENGRTDFDDIDDYHGLKLTGDDISSITGVPLTGKYSDYELKIEVSYLDLTWHPTTQVTNAKRVLLTIKLPKGDSLQFSTIRSNY